jgi:hypothetical protein
MNQRVESSGRRGLTLSFLKQPKLLPEKQILGCESRAGPQDEKREQTESGNQAQQSPKAVLDSATTRAHEDKNLTTRYLRVFNARDIFADHKKHLEAANAEI